MESVAGVIVAAGYGSFRRNEESLFPKVLEPVRGEAMVTRVATAVAKANLTPTVVVNPQSEGPIRANLEASGFWKLSYVVQPDRYGSADAVARTVSLLQALHVEHILVIYADMPLWKSETIQQLIRLHCERSATITMVTVPLQRNSPPTFKSYGRILRDDSGAIRGVVEVADATHEELSTSPSVNPSLWVWNLRWFADHVDGVPRRDKCDGHQPECHLPHLVRVAYDEGKTIGELPLADQNQALGVNTVEEFNMIQGMLIAGT